MNKTILNEVSKWIKNYATTSDLKSLVVGVSGGVDSAVVSTLCAQSRLPTIVLNLPINSTPQNTELSSLHCQWLCDNYDNVCQITVDLSDMFHNLVSKMIAEKLDNPLASANSKSRLRMVTLYHVATALNGMVVGTGNKVEDFGVGFYTKYGDGGVDISPLADMTKTQVRQAAKILGVANIIIEAPPTDGLWEDSRSDESQIGASYEELEWAMDHLANVQPADLTERQQEVLKIYNSFHQKNKHKMVGIPVFKMPKL